MHFEEPAGSPPIIRFEPFYTDPENPASIPSNNVVTLNQKKPGTLLVGTMGGGLSSMDIQDGTFTSLTQAPYSNAACMLFDKEGGLWLSNWNGILYQAASGDSFVHHSSDDGLKNTVFNFNACDEDQQGRFYMANEGGVVVFKPEDIERNPVPPPVVITDVYLFNDPLEPDTASVYKKRIELPHRENFLSFRYASLDFNAPDKNKYAYMLEGVDLQWNEDPEGLRAYYRNLDHGDYTFRVRATNNDGVWSEQEAVMYIRIRPPFWATWWFRGFALLIVSGVGYAIYASRKRTKERVEAIRRQISDDLHDDIGSNLGALSYFLGGITRRNTLRQEDEEKANMYMTSIQRMIGDLDDVVWLANPGQDHLGALIARMQITAQMLVHEMKVLFEVGELPLSTSIPMDLRRHVFLAFKEAVHNAVQHSEAHILGIKVSQHGASVRISVSDDGVGFDRKELEADGQGLFSFQRREAHDRLSISVESNPGEGTTVRMDVNMT